MQECIFSRNNVDAANRIKLHPQGLPSLLHAILARFAAETSLMRFGLNRIKLHPQFDAPTAATATICRSLAVAAVGVHVSLWTLFL